MKEQSEGMRMVDDTTEKIVKVGLEFYLDKTKATSPSVIRNQTEELEKYLLPQLREILEQLLRDVEKAIVRRLQDRLKPM